MHYRAQQLFYALSIFVLMMAIFVIRPSSVPVVASLQNDMKQKFSVAWQATMSDASYFEAVTTVYDGVADFYDQAASSAIALLNQPQQDEQMYLAFNSAYHFVADAFVAPDRTLAMREVRTIKTKPGLAREVEPHVLGARTEETTPLNKPNSWVTIADNTTGQLYCLAIYNGEVNKYPGTCPEESSTQANSSSSRLAPESDTWKFNKNQILKTESF